MKKQTKNEIVDLVGLILTRTGQNISKEKIQKARDDENLGKEIFWNIVQTTGQTTEEVIKRNRRNRRRGYENY